MTAEPTTPLPESPFCRVRARVASIWADGPDAGTSPDWRPAVGEKVTLTPSIGAQLLVYDVAGPEPIIVTVERVQCEVDADGWLVKADGRPVYIAPTDDPLLSATGWTWTASIKGKSVVFAAPTGGVVDLALFIAAPATDNTKTWVERIPELIDATGSLVGIASVTRDGDDMVVTLTNGEMHRFPMGAQIDARVDAAVAPHIAQVNLISGLTGEDSAVAFLAASPTSETRAELDRLQGRALTMPPATSVEVEDGESSPIAITRLHGYIWGNIGTQLYRSADDGQTWQSFAQMGDNPRAIMATDDGEVLIACTTRILKSTGWDGGAGTGVTFEQKVARNGAATFLPWSLAGDGTRFITTEYTNGPRSDSRYVRRTLDAGET